MTTGKTCGGSDANALSTRLERDLFVFICFTRDRIIYRIRVGTFPEQDISMSPNLKTDPTENENVTNFHRFLFCFLEFEKLLCILTHTLKDGSRGNPGMPRPYLNVFSWIFLF